MTVPLSEHLLDASHTGEADCRATSLLESSLAGAAGRVRSSPVVTVLVVSVVNDPAFSRRRRSQKNGHSLNTEGMAGKSARISLSLRQPGGPNSSGPSALRPPVARGLPLSRICAALHDIDGPSGAL